MDRKFVLINIILSIKNTKIKIYETLNNRTRKHSWKRCLIFYLLGLLIPGNDSNTEKCIFVWRCILWG